jgi:DNA-binding MarR family transcriptional regulator
MTALAEHLALHRQSVSHALQRLETRGLVTKSTDPHDRRARTLQLTRQGSAMASRFVEASRQQLLSTSKSPKPR